MAETGIDESANEADGPPVEGKSWDDGRASDAGEPDDGIDEQRIESFVYLKNKLANFRNSRILNNLK